jgi:ribosomal protein S21
MLEVRVKGNTLEDLDRALHQLKKLLDKDGVVQEMREREYFKSPGRKAYERKRTLKYKLMINKLKSEKKYDKYGKFKKKNWSEYK